MGCKGSRVQISALRPAFSVTYVISAVPPFVPTFLDGPQMTLQQLLEATVFALNECVQALSSSFPTPARVAVGDRFVFRHAEQNDLLLSFLKGVFIASANNAAIVLLRAGFVHETYALCRVIDEACEDIWFMATPLGEGGEPSQDQRRFINEFFQEEFAKPDDPLSSTKRDRVPRQRIHAAVNRIGGEARADPSTDQAVVKTLYQAFSGFIHGAYVHIMQQYGGNPPQFHTRGMLGTPRIEECQDNHVHYLYRSLLAMEQVARRAYREDVATRLCDLSIDLATRTQCVKSEEVERARRRRARKLVQPT
jgi:hypothetical protein